MTIIIIIAGFYIELNSPQVIGWRLNTRTFACAKAKKKDNMCVYSHMLKKISVCRSEMIFF